MKKLVIILLSCFCLVLDAAAQGDTILSRYKQYLFNTLRVPANAGQLASSIDSNGKWSDIDYDNNAMANWQPLIHMQRLRSLAFAYAYPSSNFYHQSQLLRSISLALQHWAEKKYQCLNWWHNEIGVPQQMRDLIILLQNDLTESQLKSALEILAQYKVTDKSTGANLTWAADLGMHYGLLTADTSIAGNCSRKIIDEIKITTGDGVQPDYSFHQHDKRLQMYQYGAAFLLENIRIAWELRNTVFAFPKEKIDVLSDFLFNGWQWMARGVNTVPGTMDRSASRMNALHGADIRKLIPYFVELLPGKKNELQAIANQQNGNSSLVGFRYYPYSDFTAYQQKDFSFFIKTISNRTLATESINSENLKGHLLNSGDTYFIHDGEEYFNLMPVWNWEYLPGVTSFKNAHHIKRKVFTGSVGNEAEGFTSMDYVMESRDGKQSLSAKKSWFCYDGKMICLIADLKGVGIDTAYTAMDQCRWRNDVTVNKGKLLTEGTQQFKNLNWVHHQDFLYAVYTKILSSVTAAPVEGMWSDINASGSDAVVHDKVFMPVLMHTNLLKPTSVAYMVSSCKNSADATAKYKQPGFKIIRNDALCQAISFTDGTIMAAFFQPASVLINKTVLQTGNACLVMIKDGSMIVSDPSQELKIIQVSVNNRSYDVELPANGFSSSPVQLINYEKK